VQEERHAVPDVLVGRVNRVREIVTRFDECGAKVPDASSTAKTQRVITVTSRPIMTQKVSA